MKQKLLYSLSISILTSAILITLFLGGFFQSWQNKLTDALYFPQPISNNIALIAIDDRSIQAIGRFPWNRSVYAKLLDIMGNQPNAIGIDVAFPEKSSNKEDLALAQALQKIAGKVILPIELVNPSINKEFISADISQIPISELASHSILGVVNTIPDEDGITRLTPINIQVNGNNYPNFSIALLTAANKNMSLPAPEMKQIPLTNGLMSINFSITPDSFKKYSFIDVMDGKVSPGEFKNKIVLIGATASDLHDAQLTPISNGSPMSGILIHAYTLQTLQSQNYLHIENSLNTVLIILLISLVLFIIFSFLNVIPATILSVLLFVFYIVYVLYSFDNGIIRNIIFPLLAILITYVLQLVFHYFAENKQKRFLRKAFSFYVSEEVLKEVISKPEKLTLGGAKKNISVLFSDIAGFTTMSEHLEPEALTKLLNEYLTSMTNLVFKHRGILDKYIGDAVMAFWGAPIEDSTHAYLACKTALQMQEQVEVIKKSWQAAGIEHFGIRIGINTGDMVVGNMGSENRFDYTLIGDNVNLGSRLEGVNKVYGTKIIISESTYNNLIKFPGHNNEEAIVRFLDRVIVKGKKKSMGIYELRGFGKPDILEAEFLNLFEKARTLYEKGEFKTSLDEFTQLHSKHSEDLATKLYINRCKELLSNPPAEWDGTYHATEK